MSYPPKERDEVSTSPGYDSADMAPAHRPARTTKSGYCESPPELGTLPFQAQRQKGRRLVRLVSSNKGSELSIELQLGVNKVGRQRNGNHIVLVSGDISRFHAELSVAEDAVHVKDLGSSNGTFVNEERITEQRKLEVGDVVSFSTQFSFQLLIDLVPEGAEAPGASQSASTASSAASTASPVAGASGGPAPARAESRPASARQALAAGPSHSAADHHSPAAVTPVSPAGAGTSNGVAPSASRQDPVRKNLSPTQPWISDANSIEVDIGKPEEPPPATPTPPTEEDPSLQAIASEVRQVESEGSQQSPALAMLERERRQLSLLYQVSKRCMSAETLSELDRLLIDVLEKIVAFDRGFITYQLPTGDWKLVMSPRGDRWERSLVRTLLQTGLKAKVPLNIPDTTQDSRLGSVGPGRPDARLLLPLRSRSGPVGAIFLLSQRKDSFDEKTVDFLSLFADIAALAVVNCSRLEGNNS